MRALVWITFLMSAGFLQAQQTPIFNNYFVNPYMLNPAMAGSRESRVFFVLRKRDSIIVHVHFCLPD